MSVRRGRHPTKGFAIDDPPPCKTMFVCRLCANQSFGDKNKFLAHLAVCLQKWEEANEGESMTFVFDVVRGAEQENVTVDVGGPPTHSMPSLKRDTSADPAPPPLEQQTVLPCEGDGEESEETDDDEEEADLEAQLRLSPRKSILGQTKGLGSSMVRKSMRRMRDLAKATGSAEGTPNVRRTSRRTHTTLLSDDDEGEEDEEGDELTIASSSPTRRSARRRDDKTAEEGEGEEGDDWAEPPTKRKSAMVDSPPAESAEGKDEGVAVKNGRSMPKIGSTVDELTAEQFASSIPLRNLSQCSFKCSTYFGDKNIDKDKDINALKERYRREQHEKMCPRRASALRAAHSQFCAAEREMATTPHDNSFISFARLPERDRTCDCTYTTTRVDKFNSHVLQCPHASAERLAKANGTKYATKLECKFGCGFKQMQCFMHAHETICPNRPNVPVCAFCSQTFSTPRVLLNHQRSCVHRQFGAPIPRQHRSLLTEPTIADISYRDRRSFCVSCKLASTDHAQFIAHVRSAHKPELREEHADFKSEVDFERWRRNVAEAENFKWIVDGRKLVVTEGEAPVQTEEEGMTTQNKDAARIVLDAFDLAEPLAQAAKLTAAPRILGYVRFSCNFSRRAEIGASERVSESMSDARWGMLASCTCYIHATYLSNGSVKSRYCLSHFAHDVHPRRQPSELPPSPHLLSAIAPVTLFDMKVQDLVHRLARDGLMREQIVAALRADFPSQTLNRSDATIFAFIRDLSLQRSFVVRQRPRASAGGGGAPYRQEAIEHAALQQRTRKIQQESGAVPMVYHTCAHCDQRSALRGDSQNLWIECRGVCGNHYHRQCINWPENTDPTSKDTVFYCTRSCYDSAMERDDEGEEEEEAIEDHMDEGRVKEGGCDSTTADNVNVD